MRKKNKLKDLKGEEREAMEEKLKEYMMMLKGISVESKKTVQYRETMALLKKVQKQLRRK